MKKRKLIKILLYICGFICIAYPLIFKFLSYKNQTEVITNYDIKMETIDKENLNKKLEEVEKFNKNVSLETIISNDAEEMDNNSYFDLLETDEILGYIQIPKINLKLPIYEKITEENLSKGVAHMENTSLPNGNLNTHSVIAGHTGISKAEIFDRISELENGDTFYINFLGNTTKYEVIYEDVVLPDDTSSIKIEENRCLVTLVTCTPKTVNTHRLLVTAEKVEEIIGENSIVKKEEVMAVSSQNIYEKSNIKLFLEFVKNNLSTFSIIFWIIIFLMVLKIIEKFIKIYTRRKNEKNS